MDPRTAGDDALTSHNSGSLPAEDPNDLTRAGAAAVAFHLFMGTCAVACVLTWLELLLYSPDGYTELPRFRTFSIYATLIAAIYAGDFLAKRLGVEGYRLATVRVSLLVAFFSVSMFVGFYVLGWHTHGATAAIFSSILICLVYSAKLAHLSLAWFGMLAIAGFSLNPMREPLSHLLSTQLSSSWSIFTSLIIPFSIAATMTYIVDRILSSHEQRQAQILESREALETLAHTDPLTGFFNRNKLEEEFSASTAQIDDTHQLLVALLDLDNFKAINTSAGHAAGDAVLKEKAKHIRSQLPQASVLRLGGDEFLLLLSTRGASDPSVLALENLAVVKKIQVGNERISQSMSIGYTIINDEHAKVGNVIAEADLALRQAKREGKGRAIRYLPGDSVPAAAAGNEGVTSFNPALTGNVIKKEIPARTIGSAILSDEIDFEFQPLFDTQTGKIVSVEALLRWRLPDGSLVPLKHYLASFVALEWQSPFIEHLSEKRLALIKEIRSVKAIDVHFNLALESIQDHDRTNQTEKLINAAETSNKGMVIELSEKRFNRALANETAGSHRMPYRERAAQMGVKLALDDFGKGESNFERLINYPVQIVKLDRAICSRVLESKKARSVIQQTRGVCDDNNITLIAEGIETLEQGEALDTLGVTIHQGFHYSRAVSKEQLLDLLARHPSNGVSAPRHLG